MTGPTGGRSTLRHEAFRAVWIAAIFSYVGDWVQAVAQSWLMLSLTKSELLVSMVTACQTLPVFVLVLPAGVMADRFDRRRMIIAALGWEAFAALTLALATWLHVATPAIVLASTACLGVGGAFAGPAWSSLVPELVPRAEMAEAVTLNSVAFNIARAVGPAIGGLLIATVGLGAAFAVNAASFLVIIQVMHRYRAIRERSTHTRGHPEPFVAAVFSVLKHVRGSPSLRAVYACISLYGLAAASVPALLPVFAKETLGAGERGFGLLLGSMGAGALLGAVVVRRVRAAISARALIAGSIALYATAASALTFTHSLGAAMAMLVPVGVAWLSSMSTLNALVLLSAPQRFKSRAIALYSLSFFATWALGAALGGALASVHGVCFVLRAAALALLAVAGLTTTLRLPPYDAPVQEVAMRESLPPPPVSAQ